MEKQLSVPSCQLPVRQREGVTAPLGACCWQQIPRWLVPGAGGRRQPPAPAAPSSSQRTEQERGGGHGHGEGRIPAGASACSQARSLDLSSAVGVV